MLFPSDQSRTLELHLPVLHLTRLEARYSDVEMVICWIPAALERLLDFSLETIVHLPDRRILCLRQWLQSIALHTHTHSLVDL